jgi:hypothetical protein
MEKVKVKYKSMCYYIKDDLRDSIFDEMTLQSRNIYNKTIFCFNVFSYYKNTIFEEIYNKINTESFKKNTNQQKEKIFKNLFIEFYCQKYKYYSENYLLMKQNNNIIYKYIKDELKGELITNFNFEEMKKLFLKKTEKLVSFNNDNKVIVFIDVLHKILQNMYNKVFYKTKYEMINNIPFTYNISKQYINLIKNNKNLFNTMSNIYYKIKEFGIHYSEQYYFRDVTLLHLGECKTKLPGDMIRNLILKIHDAIEAYYEILKSGNKANKPVFLEQDERYILIFNNNTMTVSNNNIQLTVGYNVRDNFKKIIDNDDISVFKNKYYYNNDITKINKRGYVKIAKNKYINKTRLFMCQFVNIPIKKKIKGEQIQYIEIIKEYGMHKICITYQDNKKYPEVYKIENKTEDELERNALSIDIGMRSLMTIYDPTGKQYIIKGSTINNMAYKYSRLISIAQSYDENINEILAKREQKMKGSINNIVEKLSEHIEKINKKLVIIGYNKEWKTKVNMGRKTNKKFYEIPYAIIIEKIKEKLESRGIKVQTTEESYTSKCDGLVLEKVCKKEKYMGKRKNKNWGLYESSVGKIINSDVNGAINIMRKIINLKKINGKGLFNPIKKTW